MTSIHPPSPLRTTTTYSPPSSPTNLRSPLSQQQSSRSPIGNRKDIINESSKGWSNLDNGNGLIPRRPISLQFNNNELLSSAESGNGIKSSPEAMRKAGAGGSNNNNNNNNNSNGTSSEAIGERRRQSNSFKTMSTGSLVSNSPFTKRSGSTTSSSNIPPPPVPIISGIYSNSYAPIPQPKSPQRKFSGSKNNLRKSSGDLSINTNENIGGPRKVSGGGIGGEKEINDSTPPKSASVSPSIPFRPVRNTIDSPSSPGSSILPTTNTAAATTTTTSPHKSNWGTVAPRQSSSYAASRKNALVTTSPFVNRTPSVINFNDDYQNNSSSSIIIDSSPPERVASPSTMSTFNSGMGLGIRPGGPLATTERRIAGSSIPPPSTPPSDRISSSSTSPSSALSLSRRGMKGPRAPSELESQNYQNQSQQEFSNNSNEMRSKPSTKTVTWATTEEVLEFDVVSERSRSSDASMLSTSDEGQLSDGGNERSFEFDEGNRSLGFEEGGSVEVHDFVNSDEEDAEEEQDIDDMSAVSTASTVEDMMGEIEAFMDNVSPQIDLGPRLTFDPRQRELDIASLSNALPSTLSNRSSNNSMDLDENESIYSDEEADEDVVQEAKVVKANHSQFPVESRSNATSTLFNYNLGLPTTDYSLPNLPNSSPLIGFTEGENESLDTTSNYSPSFNTISSPTEIEIPFRSTPTKSLESPIPSPFASTHSTPGLTHLSRHASILESEPYGSSLGSVRGSLRGTSKLRQGKERFDEKLKLHQAILAGESLPSSPSLSPTLSNSTSSTNTTIRSPTFSTVIATKVSPEIREEEEQPRVIQARPAINSRTAGHNNSSVLGLSLTAEVVHELESPLDRLQRGVVVSEQFNNEIASPTTSTSSAPATFSTSSNTHTSTSFSSPATTITRSLSEMSISEENSIGNSSISEERIKENSSRRKSRNSIEEGRQWSSGHRVPKRRSLSTGDASFTDSKMSSSSNKRATMPESGFAQILTSALPNSSSSFSLSVGSSLDSVYRNSQHPKYRVRETKKVVYANDGSLTTIGSAGDVDPGRAWRKKRPSDMNLIMTGDEFRAMQDQESLTGQVFVSLVSTYFTDLPITQEPTTMVCLLDNGRQRVLAGKFKLGSKIILKKEFELTCTSVLAFDIDLQIPITSEMNSHLLPNSQPPSLPPTPTSPSKSSHRFRNVFSSPKKKHAMLPPPPPSPSPSTSSRLLEYLSPEGLISSAHIAFKNEATKCRMKSVRLDIPLYSTLTGSSSILGGITIDLFHVPSIAGISKDNLPKSVEEARIGIALAERVKEVKYEGILTQMGGDCQTWRRRLIRVMGNRLVPFNEITKKSYVEIDLSSVISVEDPNAPIISSSGVTRSTSSEFDEAPWRMDNSINLKFKDGDDILFFADTKEEKDKWIIVLENLVGKKSKEAPEWAIQLIKQQKSIKVL